MSRPWFLLLLLTGCYSELAVGVRQPFAVDDLEGEMTVELLVGASLGTPDDRIGYGTMAETVPETTADLGDVAAGFGGGWEHRHLDLGGGFGLRQDLRVAGEWILAFGDDDLPDVDGHIVGAGAGLGVAWENLRVLVDDHGHETIDGQGYAGLFLDLDVGHLAVGDDSGGFVGAELRLKLDPAGLIAWLGSKKLF